MFRASGGWRVLVSLTVCACGAARAPGGEPGDLILRLPFEALAPQDITWDGNLYYITTFLDGKIHRYQNDLKTPLAPLPTPFHTNLGLTGIAFNEDPENPRLWILEPLSRTIQEVDLAGMPTDQEINPEFEHVVNPGAEPIPRGMAFDRTGNGGAGTLWVAESVGSLIYEIALDGRILRKLTHPDDADGFPGNGASAPLYDVQPIHDPQGALTGLYVTGGRGRTDYIRRLDADGQYTGFSVPLEWAGGTVSGFLIRDLELPGEKPVPGAVVALVESAAKMVVLDGTFPPIGDLQNLTCTTEDRAAVLSWRNGSLYDRIELYRDCVLVATLPGNEVSAREEGLGPGLHTYELRAALGGKSVSSGECGVVVEGGRVLRQASYPGRFPIDLAVDPQGFIYISDFLDRRIYIFDEAFQFQVALDLEFLTEEDRATGLAYSGEFGGRLYVYNSNENVVVETDLGGLPLRAIPIALPNDPDDPLDKAVVAGMTFDPDGADRRGALWFIELRRATVYAFSLEGDFLASFVHPVARQWPVPPRSSIFNHLGAISEVPGLGFDFLDLTSGSLFERDVKRIIRVSTATGEALPGVELTLAGQDLAVASTFVGIQHAVKKNGRPVLYATGAAGNASLLMEIDPTLPLPRPLGSLTARQRGRAREVELTFEANDDYQRIVVERDCAPLAEIPAGQFARGEVSFVDTGVPAGSRQYSVRGFKDGVETPVLEVQVMVGPGAVLGREFSHPASSPVQLTRDPEDGSLLVSSTTPGQERSIFRFRPDLTYAEVLENVLPAPWEIAAMAARVDAVEGKQIYVIAWSKPAALGEVQTFPLFILSGSGTVLRQLTVTPPRPSNGFVTYPTGLAWDPRDRVFYYLERNSATIVRMDAAGNTLALIPHPSPPVQSFVFNLGLSLDPENGALYLTSAGPRDRRITKTLQLTRGGRLTGLEFAFGTPAMNPLSGIVTDGPDLIVAGHDAAGTLQRLQLFQPLPAPKGLTCVARGADVLLSWEPPAGSERTVVLRNGAPVTSLAAGVSTWLDRSPGRDRYLVYSVAAQNAEGDAGKNAYCEVPRLPAGFIRGDADQSRDFNVTDPILLLNFLFLGGSAPPCDDAADADDNGEISITDSIRMLGVLFLGDLPLPPPYPAPGEDPTADGLSCS